APLTGPHGLDEQTAADLLDELKLDPTARWLAEHRLRDHFAVDPDHVSLLYLCQQARLPPKLGTFRIRDGNDALPKALAGGLDIEGNHPVASVVLSRS